MPIVFAQTAAGPDYVAMLDATDPLHRAFCDATGATFVRYVGVRRGFHPWQASFNRIEMIADLVDQGFAGWFMYLDADAVVRQAAFDIERYLGKRTGYGLIAAPSVPGAERWDINNGIFFLNLGHPLGVAIARRWRELAYETVTETMLREAVAPWQQLPDGRSFPDDQHLLQVVLRDELGAGLLVDDTGLFNGGGGRFIKQFTRASGDNDARLAALRSVAMLAASAEIPVHAGRNATIST